MSVHRNLSLITGHGPKVIKDQNSSIWHQGGLVHYIYWKKNTLLYNLRMIFMSLLLFFQKTVIVMFLLFQTICDTKTHEKDLYMQQASYFQPCSFAPCLCYICGKFCACPPIDYEKNWDITFACFVHGKWCSVRTPSLHPCYWSNYSKSSLFSLMHLFIVIKCVTVFEIQSNYSSFQMISGHDSPAM